MKMDSCKAGNNSDQIFENEGIRKRCLWVREEEKAGRGKKEKGTIITIYFYFKAYWQTTLNEKITNLQDQQVHRKEEVICTEAKLA